MKLIAGLGNPGPRYLMTRHNAGWMALDYALHRFGLAMSETKHRSPFLKTRMRGQDVSFLKPALYMNRSGGPIRAAMEELDIDTERLLVIHDDIDIPLGEARYKLNGGHGGHNGVQSVIAELAANDFHRIRIGLGRPPEGVDAADYVLYEVAAEEQEALLDAFDRACTLMESRFLAA